MDFDKLVEKWVLFNKYKYGNININSVISKLIYEDPELKKNIREIIQKVKEISDKYINISIEDAYNILKRDYPELLEEKKKEEKIGLPSLEDAVQGKVITRFAPNPSGFLHIGHARAIIINYEYARMYKGKFILRIEDTDPKVKKPDPTVYNYIKDDTEWLIDDRIDEFYIQSERLEIYYRYIKELLEKGFAYIDLSPKEVISKYRFQGIETEYRNKDVEWNLEQFDRILSGEYDEEQAVIRIKTDLSYPNPSVRDWIAFRIVNPRKNIHPYLLGKYGENYAEKYWLWPAYNFSVSIDDHLMGVSHIFRMKEHEVNSIKQKYIYDYLGWEFPTVINYGSLLVKDMPLHKSEIKKLISEGKISGWDDPFIPTLRGLKRRGVSNIAIKKYIIEININPVDVYVNWDKIYSYNREIYDKTAKRFFILRNPVKIRIENLDLPKKIIIKNHPEVDLGNREYNINSNIIYIDNNDINNKYLRLMEGFNIEIIKDGNNIYGKYISETIEDAKKFNAKIVQWIPDEYKEYINLWESNGKYRGLSERYIYTLTKDGEVIHAIRYGFLKREKDTFIYLHK
ncbi:glutamate--tRNA ligase [Nanobdella aerobiophila]|uniref:Glutamate--tRNA ligase n=1 Tax=Nanobdella aerobiophila TaxID=2586965 RepID=A0A915SCZ5_9ARCH|nr:glutamate--tRNA ligase [Nanobdella aerobiophila]BBL45793.1 glutamate--tRNA ligase [Nanobdella aerobiophila]